MSSPKISQEEINNKELFEFAKSSLVCSICNGIMIEPQQCTQCLSYFCLECAKVAKIKSEKCPIQNCPNFLYAKSESSQNMLEKLTFKCKNECGTIINYLDLKKHYESECPKMNYAEKYLDNLAMLNYMKFQLKNNKKKLEKINSNVEHSKDAHYYVEKMKNHPSANRDDWDTYENDMRRKFNQFRSSAESQDNHEPGLMFPVELNRRVRTFIDLDNDDIDFFH